MLSFPVGSHYTKSLCIQHEQIFGFLERDDNQPPFYLQIIPAQINNVKGNQLISVMEKTFDSDGKFVRWEHVSHNVKQIHDAADLLKKECHSLFRELRMKGVERILFDEANKRTGGLHVYNFDENNMDDDMSVESMLVESETLLPELEHQEAVGTQDDASDEISCLTDPTSPNLAFTLPQPQQSAPHDFGQGNNESHEYFNEDPFMNPAIDGHEWQVTET